MNQKIDQNAEIETTETTETDTSAPRKPLTLSRQAVRVLKVRSGVQTGGACKEGVSHKLVGW